MSRDLPALTRISFVVAVFIPAILSIKLDQTASIGSDELRLYLRENFEEDVNSLPAVALALEVLSNPPSAHDLCAKASQILASQDVELFSTASAAIIVAKLKCKEKSAAVNALPKLWNLAMDGNNVLAYAAVTGATRQLAGVSKVKLTERQVEAVGKFLTEIKAPSGKARWQAGGPVSMLATGLAYRIIDDGKALKVKWSGKASAAVNEFSGQISEVLESAAENNFVTSSDSCGLEALSYYLDAVIALNAGAVTLSQKAALAGYVSSFRTVGSFEEATWLLKAKQALQSLEAKSFRLEVGPQALTLGKKDESVKISIRDEASQVVSVDKVRTSMSNNKGKRLAEIEAGKGSGGTYDLDITEYIDSAGKYRLKVTAETAESSVTEEFQLVVRDAGHPGNARLDILKEDNSELASEEAAWPTSVSSVLKAPSTSIVQVTLLGDVPKPAPVVRLACKQGNEALVVAFKKNIASLASSLVHEELECQEIEISLEPASPASDFRGWVLGSVKLSKPGRQRRQQDLFSPKPLISHLFRKPDKRPMKAISLLFAGLAVLPLAGLLFSLQISECNLKGLPSNGDRLLPAFVFHAGLVGLVAVYAAFWLRLNLLQTIPLLAILAVILTVSGYFHLSKQAASRLKQL